MRPTSARLIAPCLLAAIAAGCTDPGADLQPFADVELTSAALVTSGPVLLVAGSTTLTPSDTAIRSRLQSYGYTVTVKSGSAAVSGDATGKELVFISATVNPADVNTKFRDAAVPVIVCEHQLFGDMYLVYPWNSPPDWGTTTGQTQLSMVEPASHPLAAGLFGTVAVSSAAITVGWGRVGDSADRVATVVGNPSLVAIFGYDAGKKLGQFTNAVAPARRVGFPLQDTAAASLNANGWALFDAAVHWATAPKVSISVTDGVASEAADPGAFTVTRSRVSDQPLDVFFTWAGTATPWQDYDSPTMVTIPAGAASAPLPITPMQDTAFEGPETVSLNIISNGSHDPYVPGPSAWATLTLADDDPGPAVLFVAASTTLGAGDTAARNRIQGLGYPVTVKAASAATAADATGKGLVVISSSVASGDVNNKFRNVTVPVLTWEALLFDDMGMVSTASGQSGTQAGSTLATSIAAGHPLGAGLSGTVTVTTSSDTLSWGIPGSNAFKIATIPGASTKAAVFAYEPGTSMPGLTAPARRVGLFLADATATKLTAAGWSLFDAAVTWAATPFPAAMTTQRALMLVDRRLYRQLGPIIDEYRTLAEQRRGFSIALHAIDGIDQWRHDAVKAYIKRQRTADPSLEGVLFIGNIKLPSFFQSRTDTADTRLITRYYEDLDGVFSKHLADNSTIPPCPIEGLPYNCYGGGGAAVPAHDFDHVAKGPAPDPEIWTSYMPVGLPGVNNYETWGLQLQPFLERVLNFYQGELSANGRLYFLTPDIGEQPERTWDAFGNQAIDIYGRRGPNGETFGDCIQNGVNLCYVRWPIESYSDAQTFISDVRANWPGDRVWLDPAILISHMNDVFSVLEITAHSDTTESVLSSEQARGLNGGGLFVPLSGCGVAGFFQPGSPSFVNTGTSVYDNVLMSYVYGSSATLAGAGDPFWRGHYAKHPSLYLHLKQVPGSYLGLANHQRIKELYQISTDDGSFREFGMEMLVGDPFMDLQAGP
jgi:hypothetical protein